MADTSDFRNGLIIRYKNEPYAITEFQHVKPGKGGAFVRSTLKILKQVKYLIIHSDQVNQLRSFVLKERNFNIFLGKMNFLFLWIMKLMNK